jgi:hypothetical protein
LSIGHNNVFHEEEVKMEDWRKGRGGCDSVKRGKLEKNEEKKKGCGARKILVSGRRETKK